VIASDPPRRDRDSDAQRLPWLDGDRAAPTPASVAVAHEPGARGMRWFLSLLILALVAAGAFVLGKGSDPVTPATTPVVVPMPRAAPAALPPPLAPPAVAASGATPPALARVAGNEPAGTVPPAVTRVVHVVDARPAEGLHLTDAQVVALRKIAREAEVNVHRNQQAKATPPRVAFAPRVGPSGRVVQLGAYNSARDAEAAAQLFRYKYRGLLATLPKAVLPFRPKGTRRMFYRVQFVTPSQAYSEVTCQRLRAAAKTCIVLY
jgi:hypothetical protein